MTEERKDLWTKGPIIENDEADKLAKVKDPHSVILTLILLSAVNILISVKGASSLPNDKPALIGAIIASFLVPFLFSLIFQISKKYRNTIGRIKVFNYCLGVFVVINLLTVITK